MPGPVVGKDGDDAEANEADPTGEGQCRPLFSGTRFLKGANAMRNEPDDASKNHPSQCKYLGHCLIDQTVVAIQTVFAKQHEAADHQAKDKCSQAEAGDTSP